MTLYSIMENLLRGWRLSVREVINMEINFNWLFYILYIFSNTIPNGELYSIQLTNIFIDKKHESLIHYSDEKVLCFTASSTNVNLLFTPRM